MAWEGRSKNGEGTPVLETLAPKYSAIVWLHRPSYAQSGT
jgi:hypothetical protein